MKKRKILYFVPLCSLLLTGCDFASVMDKAKELGGKVVNPIKDLFNRDEKEGNKEEDSGNHEEGGGGEEQQAVAVSIKELIGIPAEIEQGATLAAAGLSAKVVYSDNSEKTEPVTKVELDTSKVGEASGKAYVNSLSKVFSIKVVAKEVPPVGDTISPQDAVALMDQAGDGVVVQGLKKVKGICASGSKYDSQYGQYTTGFEGVENFKLQFTDNDNILNGASPDGMEIVVEGYLEKYQGKYQLSYLPASASPTGEKFTPNLVSAQAVIHEGVLDSITVSSAHREFYKGSTFVEETVTAHYSDGATATVKGTFTGYDMNTLGEQTVTVSYTENGVTQQTTYTINVIERGSGHAGTLEDPLTTAEAVAIANGLAETTDSKNPIASEGMYVKGVVTEFKETFSADYGNYSIVIGGDFTLWRIKNGPNFAKFNAGDIEVGDEVTAFVYIMNFKGTPESTSNSYVHSVQKAGDTKTLQSIEIVGSLTKTSYVEGQTYSSAGLSVKGHYDDGSEGVVAATITLDKTTAALGDTEIVASATFKEITAEPKTFTVTVTEKSPVAEGDFYKVKSQDEITEGQYLLVYEASETEAKVFNGIDVATKDGASAVDAAIEIDHIAANDSFVKVALETMDGGFALKVVGGTNDGKYMCGASGTNTTKFEETKQLNTITHSETGDSIVSNTSTIMYNKASDQARFRYYKEGTTSQQPVHLYKMKDGGTPTPVKELTSISIEGSLAKTTYTEGEAYSTEGLSVKGHYDDGTDAIVAATITLDKTTAAVGDTQIVANAEFNGKTATKDLAVTVNAKKIVTGITFSEEHRTFDQYAEFVKETVTATFTVGDPEIVEATFSTPDMTTEGEKTITVSYTDEYGTTVNNSYVITVVGAPEPELTGITIEGELEKTEYTVGEAYSAAGLSVVAHYDNGTNTTVDVTISLNKDVAALGDTSITASATYEGNDASKDFAVTVSEEQAQKGTLENPYTVAEVLEAYKDLPVYDSSSDAGKNACFSNERVYVQGLITGDAPSTPQYTLEGGLIVYKPAAPTEFIRPCKGDVAIFEGYVEHYTTAFELASNTNHPGNPTCVSVVSRGTSSIVIDASVENATVNVGSTAVNASTLEFTVTPAEGYQIAEVSYKVGQETGSTVITANEEGKYSLIVTGKITIFVETAAEGEKLPEVYKTAIFAAANSKDSLSSYTAKATYTTDEFVVTVENFNNNKLGWDFIKCGRKKPKSGSGASIATITTEQIDKEIVEIEIDFGTCTTTALNEAYILVSSNNNMSDATKVSFTPVSGETVKVAIPEESVIENGYYQIVFDCAEGSDNGFIVVNAVSFSVYSE